MSNLQLGPTGVLLTLSAFSFLLNGTFLIVICKSWKLVKRKRITYHVTNLAISDCAVGASTFCYHISLVAAGRITNLSLVFYRIAWMAVLTSLLSVCLMAIERAVCIKKTSYLETNTSSETRPSCHGRELGRGPIIGNSHVFLHV